jgi:hypothetical protein
MHKDGVVTDEEFKAQRDMVLSAWRGCLQQSSQAPVVGGSSGTDVVAAMREEHAHNRDKWRTPYGLAMQTVKGFERDYTADKERSLTLLQETYEARCANDKFPLAPFEKLVLGYLLYPQNKNHEFSAYVLASMLLTVPNDTQLSVHNWSIADQMPQGRMEPVANAILNLQVALLPMDTPKLRALNNATLNQVSSQPVGGGPRAPRRLADLLDDPSGAGYLLPVTDLATGQHVGNADMGVVEEAIGNVLQQIQALQANLATLQATQVQLAAAQRPGQQASGRTTSASGYQQQPRRPRPNQQQPQQFNQQRPQSAQQLHQHQQQFGSPGQHQTNGRGRSRARGGEAPDF